ncbi:unannotated protein [freshwater metagenome]|uniref:Unannotated protein n=1 Tax=freshwater metagenome TaxID=449393 RepID=A0A6J6I6J8_9ZZZZ
MWSAVVGNRAADDLVLVGLASQFEVLLGHLPCTLHGFTTTGSKEHTIQVTRCALGDALGHLNGLGVGVTPDREVLQLLGLLGHRVGDLITAVTGVDDEEPREPVKVLAALVVPDVGTFTLNDDGHVATIVEARVAREVHP